MGAHEDDATYNINRDEALGRMDGQVKCLCYPGTGA